MARRGPANGSSRLGGPAFKANASRSHGRNGSSWRGTRRDGGLDVGLAPDQDDLAEGTE